MRNIKGFSAFLLGMVSLLFLFTFSVFVTLNSTWLYFLTVGIMGLNKRYEVSLKILTANFHKMVAYLQNPLSRNLQLTKFPLSAKAAIHFQDVKGLIQVNNWLLVFAVLVLVLLLAVFKLGNYWWRLIPFFSLILLFMGIGGLVALLDFNDVFIYFHQLVFANFDWVFNPKKDPVIDVLPDQYFFAAFLLFLIIFFIGLLFFRWLGVRQLKKD